MVKVSAVLIDMIPEPVDSPVPIGLASANSSINNKSPLVRQMASEDNFYMEEVVVADLDICDYVVGGPTSTCLKSAGVIVDLAGGVTVGVSSPADLAGDITVVVSSTADLAGGVTVGVVLSAVAEVPSSADIAEVASDVAGDVTVGVTSLADPAGVVTTGVAFREECEVPSGSVCDYDEYFYDDDKPFLF